MKRYMEQHRCPGKIMLSKSSCAEKVLYDFTHIGKSVDIEGLPRLHWWQRTCLPMQETGDMGSIPGLGRSPVEPDNTLEYSCWRIPWTEEPGRLQSVGSQRVGHNWNGWAHIDTENRLVIAWNLRMNLPKLTELYTWSGWII